MKSHYRRSLPENASAFNILIFFGLVVIGFVVYFAFIGSNRAILREMAGKEDIIYDVSADINREDLPAEFVITLPDSERKSENTFPSGNILAGNNSLFLEFNKDDYETALNDGKLIMLYFYSRWCYTCKTEAAEALYPAIEELDNENVVGFHLNLNDNEVDDDELKIIEENNIFYQNTKLFIKNGINIFLSFETWDKERYLFEITQLL